MAEEQIVEGWEPYQMVYENSKMEDWTSEEKKSW